MTVFSVVVFLHLAGALALFIGYGIEWTASDFFRSATSAEQLRAWLRVFKVSPPLSGAGLGVLLLSGGYLASLDWYYETRLDSRQHCSEFFVALVLGFALILPRMKRIRAALPAGNEPFSSALRSAISDPVLLTAIRVRVMLATGIVYLMVAKLPLDPSLLVLAVAAALGVVFSLSVWKRTPAVAASS